MPCMMPAICSLFFVYILWQVIDVLLNIYELYGSSPQGVL
jgi:hypothetical protein